MSHTSVLQLVRVPAAVTLAVTLLRLVGELAGWSPTFFSREAGGGSAIVGIAWLVPVFGGWFGWALARAGERPASFPRAFVMLVLAFAVVPLAGFVAARAGVNPTSLSMLWIFVGAAVVAIAVAAAAWPALGRTLLAYALAARIPVVIVMLLAMLGNWGTHYDVAPPDFPEMGTLAKWFTIGVAPQLTIWIAYTLVIGGLIGLVAAAIAARGHSARPEPAV
jgi:hypothetical protein